MSESRQLVRSGEGEGRRAPAADALVVGLADVLASTTVFVLSLVVVGIALRGAPIAVIAALHAGVVCFASTLFLLRMREGGELALPLLLLMSVTVSGPLGAGGCLVMELFLLPHRSDPRRLSDWYDYIAGVSRRSVVEETYAELISGRLSRDVAAPVHRFNPILSGSSLAQQQRVLGAIGRQYHPEFHGSLKRALRNRNILVRAQAAAIASLLAPEDKTRLWRGGSIERRELPQIGKPEGKE